jgi:hypothetical protein
LGKNLQKVKLDFRRINMRSEYEIEKELKRFVDRRFIEDHRILKESGVIDEFLNSKYQSEVVCAKGVLEFNAILREKYKYDPLFQKECDSFELGVIQGKIAALRWVNGEDWDKIDPYLKEILLDKMRNKKQFYEVDDM